MEVHLCRVYGWVFANTACFISSVRTIGHILFLTMCNSVVVAILLWQHSKISNYYFLEMMHQKLSVPLCLSRITCDWIVHLRFSRHFLVTTGLGWFHHIDQIALGFFFSFRRSTLNLAKLSAALAGKPSLFVFKKRLVSYHPLWLRPSWSLNSWYISPLS